MRVTPIRLLTADDHPLMREGIAALVATQSDIELVAEASDGREAVEKFRLHRPDVALMDLQMPGLSGIDAIIAIRNDFPNARIIVLTTYGGDNLAKRALSAGAQAYVLKSLVRKELLDTVRAVHKGQKRIHPEVADGLASHIGDETLSARELSVLELIAAGNSNKRIAVHMCDRGRNRQRTREEHSGEAPRKRSYPCCDAGPQARHNQLVSTPLTSRVLDASPSKGG